MINKIKNITALFFCSALIFSCTNFMNAGAKKSSAADKNAVVMFYGTIQDFSGALPEDIAKLCADLKGGAERSAVPVYSFDTEIQYFAVAECGSDKRDGTFENDSNIFSVALGSGKKWKITCGICENGNTDNIFMSETKTFDIKASNPVLSYTFTPKPGMTGNGKIDLEFKFNNEGSYRIDYFNAIINGQNYSGDILGDNGYLIINQLQSGIYDVTFKFYNNNDTPDSAYDDVMLYYTVQTIAVFDKMTTNTWVSDGNITIDGNKLSVTDAVIEAFEDNSIYVGSTNKGQAASDTNAGTVYTPFKTLQRAINKIETTGNGKDYTIFVYGTVQGCTKIPDTIVKGTNGKASSITITGINNAVLDGNVGNTPKGYGHVLWIQSNVPVTIRDIKITGGNTIYDFDGSVSGTVANGEGDGSGGGICIAPQSDDSKVVIDGCNITGNHASYGGGIYIENSKVKITNTNIKYNYADTNGNHDQGGGISIYSGAEVTLGSGCVIESNTARKGGGVDIAIAKLFLDGAEIKSNKALNYSSNGTGGGLGGGIYFDAESNAAVFITRGIISGNIAEQHGGGIYFNGNGEDDETFTLSITGGTIENNKAEENGVAGEGGAVYVEGGDFSLGGDAYIPAIDGAGKNDIYLASAADPLLLASALSKHSQAKPVNCRVLENVFSRGKTLVSSAFEMSDEQAAAFKFYFVNEDNEAFVTTDKKSIYINAAIYVAGTGTDASPYYICRTAGNNTNGDGSKQKPYATISKAITKMTDATVPYIIKVDGTIIGNQEIPSTLYPTSPGLYYAASVLIQGASTVKKDDGSPRDSLNGNFSSKAEGNITLKISSRVPVTLKHITITGGKSDGKYEAGGLHVDSNCNVTLDENAYVINNETTGCGGGIYNSGTLTVKSGAKISGNTIDTGTTSSDDGGCAIYSVGSGNTLIIEGGEISSNTCTEGRGVIYLTGKCFIYGDAEICNNNVSSDFGGIYLASGVNPALLYLGYKSCNDDNTPNEIKEWTGKIDGNTSELRGSAISGLGTVYMNSGTISNNNQEGPDSSGFAAIYLYGTSQSKFVMTGGVIKNNKSAGNPGNAFLLDGAPLVLSGSAYIPCGSDQKHCVSLGEYSGVKATINIAGKLEPPEECTDGIVAAVQPKTYEVNTPILTISESPNPSTTIAAEVDKFALVQNGSGHYCISGKNGQLKNGYLLTSQNIDDVIAAINSGSAGQTLVLESSNFGSMKNKLQNNNLTKSVVLDMTDSGITTIGNYFFYTNDPINVSKVILPPGITEIGKDAFWNCELTEEVVLPDSVTELGEGCFGNSGIKIITLPQNLVTIGDGAFYQCYYLEEITIPASVTTIEPYSGGDNDSRNGASPFIGCRSLKSITVAEGNANYQSIDGVLIDKVNHKIMIYPANKADTEYITPSGITGALPYSFYELKCLEKLTLSNEITAIPAYFTGYSSISLKELTIGTGCTSIGKYAFSSYANKLNTVNFSNPNGWKADGTSISSEDLSNTGTAAWNLRSNRSGAVWTRTP